MSDAFEHLPPLQRGRLEAIKAQFEADAIARCEPGQIVGEQQVDDTNAFLIIDLLNDRGISVCNVRGNGDSIEFDLVEPADDDETRTQ